MKNPRIEAIIATSSYASDLTYDEDQANYAFVMCYEGECVPCRVAPFTPDGLEVALSAFGNYSCLTFHKGDGYSSLGFALEAFFG